jgi:hypothetical protein
VAFDCETQPKETKEEQQWWKKEEKKNYKFAILYMLIISYI